VLKQTPEDGPARAALHGDAIGVFGLAQDLGLADDHRIQRRGHPQHVAHGFVTAVLVGHVFEVELDRVVIAREISIEKCNQSMAGTFQRPRQHQYLYAIAGGEERGFLDFVAGDEFLKQRPRLVDGQELAHLDGCTFVIHTQKNHLHKMTSKPITAKRRKTNPATALIAERRELCLPVKRANTTTA